MSVAEAVDWAAAEITLSSRDVCALLDVTYRQLDYTIRAVPEVAQLDSMNAGSGSRRRWDLATVARLFVAARLSEAVNLGGDRRGSQWLPGVRAVMRGPVPPAQGFVILDPDGDVHYRDTLPDDTPIGPVGLVVRYDMGDIEAVGLLLGDCARAAERTEVVR
jgi:hypothetical protein